MSDVWLFDHNLFLSDLFEGLINMFISLKLISTLLSLVFVNLIVDFCFCTLLSKNSPPIFWWSHFFFCSLFLSYLVLFWVFCPMFPVSLDCPVWIFPSIFCSVYVEQRISKVQEKSSIRNFNIHDINDKENRRGNQEWTI